jgi:hypothetical protein
VETKFASVSRLDQKWGFGEKNSVRRRMTSERWPWAENFGGGIVTGNSTALPVRSPEHHEIERLETHVYSRLNGRVRHFRLVLRGCGLISTGQARTYYAKQLAQHAVMEATALPIIANQIEVY